MLGFLYYPVLWHCSPCQTPLSLFLYKNKLLSQSVQQPFTRLCSLGISTEFISLQTYQLFGLLLFEWGTVEEELDFICAFNTEQIVQTSHFYIYILNSNHE